MLHTKLPLWCWARCLSLGAGSLCSTGQLGLSLCTSREAFWTVCSLE